MTDTATRTQLAESTLVLVEYTGTEQPAGVYFASRSDYLPDWACLIVPTEDERSTTRHMWTVGDSKRAFYGIPEQDTKEYRGWNIPPHDFTVVPTPDTTPDLSDAETRKALPVTVAYPVGSVWNHITYGQTPCRVTGHRDGDVLVSTPGDSAPRAWTRGALDTHGTLVSLPTGEEDPPETADTSSIDDAFERGKREGLAEAQARWDRWKEDATRTAHEYAEENSLCSEFDRCMSDIGLPTREDMQQEFTVTYIYTTTVTARDEEEARESAQEEDYASYGEWTVEVY